MTRSISFKAVYFVAAAIAAIALAGVRPAHAASAADFVKLEHQSAAALKSLYAHSPGAKALGDKAKGILVFPDVTRVGLILGGQGGDGTLFEHGKANGFYSTGALSIGLQAGAQSYGYALFLMTDEDVNYLKTTSGNGSGWALGVGPTIVVVDAGAAKDASTFTGKSGVYAFIFGQKGLMAGVGITGSKITKIVQ